MIKERDNKEQTNKQAHLGSNSNSLSVKPSSKQSNISIQGSKGKQPNKSSLVLEEARQGLHQKDKQKLPNRQNTSKNLTKKNKQDDDDKVNSSYYSTKDRRQSNSSSHKSNRRSSLHSKSILGRQTQGNKTDADSLSQEQRRANSLKQDDLENHLKKKNTAKKRVASKSKCLPNADPFVDKTQLQLKNTVQQKDNQKKGQTDLAKIAFPSAQSDKKGTKDKPLVDKSAFENAHQSADKPKKKMTKKSNSSTIGFIQNTDVKITEREEAKEETARQETQSGKQQNSAQNETELVCSGSDSVKSPRETPKESSDEAIEESEDDDIEAETSDSHGRTLLTDTAKEEEQTEQDKAHEAYMKAYKERQRQQLLIVPPPQDLIAKTVYLQEEPVKTGAPISFVGVERLVGTNKQEEQMSKESPEVKKTPPAETYAVELKPDVAEIRSNSTQLHQYMMTMSAENLVVYCRYGKDYINTLQKQQQHLINTAGLSAPMRQIATYLINIKKLVRDHNIDSETKDFNKLKTTKAGKITKKVELPPTPFYVPTGPEDKTLTFESRFETGNLLSALKVSDHEYDLILQNDINTNGHTQWYFFRVGNTRQGHTVKFNILNLAKPDSLYNYGMKVLSFSTNARRSDEELGWHRVGEDIRYYQNNFKRENTRFSRPYYTFTFTHTFEHDDDQVYFAHCFPYTYSDLVDDLSRIEKDRSSQNVFHRSTLTRTLAGNRCEYITITSKDKDPKSEKAMAKKGVFLSARVHPGESNSSWMMKGIIEYLVSNAPEAQVLRDNFVFKIVPMLNPDGVINGNYRCALSGQDLNRRWKNPSKILHPVNSAVKKLVRSFNKEREMALFCDLHGHSRRKNIFMYGNNFEDKPHATRVFPYIMSKLCDYFSFEYSRFSVHKSKESTARVTMWKELKIPNVFTMEASFSGADKGDLENCHFQTDHLMAAGRSLLEALLIYCKIDVTGKVNEIKGIKTETAPPSKYSKISFDKLEKELTENKKLIEMTKGDEDGDDDDGSDSEPSEDNLEEEEMAKIIPIKPKKKPAEPEKKQKEKKSVQQVFKKQSRTKIGDDQKSPTSKQGARQSIKPTVSRSPVKRIFPYSSNPHDRMKMRQIRKIEMVDAWTQTSNHGSDNEEAIMKTRRHIRSKGHQGPKSQAISMNQIPGQDNKMQDPGSKKNIYMNQNSSGSNQIVQQNPASNSANNGFHTDKRRQMTRTNTNEHKLTSLERLQHSSQMQNQIYQKQFYEQFDRKIQESANNKEVIGAYKNSGSGQKDMQIRIRKDPIKSSGYKKPPSLAIFEESLLNKQHHRGSNSHGQHSQLEGAHQMQIQQNQRQLNAQQKQKLAVQGGFVQISGQSKKNQDVILNSQNWVEKPESLNQMNREQIFQYPVPTSNFTLQQQKYLRQTKQMAANSYFREPFEQSFSNNSDIKKQAAHTYNQSSGSYKSVVSNPKSDKKMALSQKIRGNGDITQKQKSQNKSNMRSSRVKEEKPQTSSNTGILPQTHANLGSGHKQHRKVTESLQPYLTQTVPANNKQLRAVSTNNQQNINISSQQALQNQYNTNFQNSAQKVHPSQLNPVTLSRQNPQFQQRSFHREKKFSTPHHPQHASNLPQLQQTPQTNPRGQQSQSMLGHQTDAQKVQYQPNFVKSQGHRPEKAADLLNGVDFAEALKQEEKSLRVQQQKIVYQSNQARQEAPTPEQHQMQMTYNLQQQQKLQQLQMQKSLQQNKIQGNNSQLKGSQNAALALIQKQSVVSPSKAPL